jgi:hypothetical protein
LKICRFQALSSFSPNKIQFSKFLLVVATTVILGSKFHKTHGHILLSDDSGVLQYRTHALFITARLAVSGNISFRVSFLSPTYTFQTIE